MPHGSLSYALVRPEGRAPERWLLFLHGALGRGGNWRSIARRVVDARPSFGAALVDLRAHGASQGMPGPNTIAQAAIDLDGVVLPGPVGGVIGHSLGGKIALASLGRRAVAETWVIDANPGIGMNVHSATREVVGALKAAGEVFASRREFGDRMTELGFGALAEGLATNLVRNEQSFRLALDLPAIEALIDDYAATDLWPIVERPPPEARVQVVVGRRSGMFSAADRERLAATPARVHELDTGHWVHVDDPDGMVRLLVENLR